MTAAPWEVPPAGPAAAIATRLAAAVPVLETERLRLRAPRIEDFDAYLRIVDDDRGVHVGGPLAREAAWLDFAQMVAGWLLRGVGVWSVDRRADDRLIGFLPLNHEFGDPEVEIGWFLLPEAEGHGYAAEAATAARAFAFEALGWRTLVSYVDPDNARSVRVAERLGARAERGLFEGVRVYRHHASEAGA